MLKTMSWAKAGSAAGLFMLASAPTAFAQANCEMYAKLAVQQQRQNESSKCDLKGPDWSADLQGHMSWCTAASPQQWQAALQRRKQALDNCGK
ncbi:MAG: hypothetical protein Q7T86_09700 [Hyphomicrobiaceae bacterium]|nr:hypothetical protein [Hyphomicrobiaceae bacterium]